MAAIETTRRPAVPPLQPGDRLTRPEFERRFDATPNLKKAELIEGVVYMPPPVSHAGHAAPHLRIGAWLGVYLASTPGITGGDNASLRLDFDNMPQPDAYLMIAAASGGQARIDEEGYVAGAPELVVEVSASTVSFDLHAKRAVYRRAGVKEYLVWRVMDQAIDWFILRSGEFEPLEPGTDGLLRSAVFAGLWLEAEAMITGDLGAVLNTVQRGVTSPEHAQFVERLQQAASRND